MARGRAANSQHRPRGPGDGAILAAQRAIDKEDEYKRNVNKLQAMANVSAERLVIGGDIEAVLKEVEGDEKAHEFLTSVRDRLKSVAEGNAKRMLEIEYFVQAVGEVKAQVEQRQNENGNGEDGEEEGGGQGIDKEIPNYELLIHETIDTTRKRAEECESYRPLDEHEFSIQLRDRLGEKKSKKRSRFSRGGDGDDDDDLEVVNNRVDDVHTLKCPITGMLFQDPVKNKQCHHTYSREGLQQMVRNKKKTCPVPGCPNNNVSMAQVDDDEEMKMKVRRFRAREEAERRQRDLNETMEDED